MKRNDYEPSRGYRIYRNLHKGNFTVQGWVIGKGWLKIDEGVAIKGSGVTFKIYSKGREQVLREKRKNVHAYVLCRSYEKLECFEEKGVRVRYNPYQMETFQTEDGKELNSCDNLVLTPKGNFMLTF